MSIRSQQVRNLTPEYWVEVPHQGAWRWEKLLDKKVSYLREEAELVFEDWSLTLRTFDELLCSEEDPQGVPSRRNVPEWDEYFLGIAEAVAKRAKCRRRQVGAVIVDVQHRIISTGYNGFPAGVSPDCLEGGCPRGLTRQGDIAPDSPYTTPGSAGFCPALHAETGALLWAGKDTQGTTIYITDRPCPDCQRLLAGAGIERAVWPEGSLIPTDLYSPKKKRNTR